MGLTRSLDKAREAYSRADVDASRTAHDAKSGRLEPAEQHLSGGQYLKSAVYGGLDGIITTFAVVAGVAGASLGAGIVLIMGFANLIGDGISMAVGDYLSTKSEREYRKRERARESWEVKNYIEGEKKEMVEIYSSKGISEKDAKVIVDRLSKYDDAFVDVMMVEELGIIEDDSSPLKNALVTFGSFVIFGLMPLFAYLAAFIFSIHSDMFLIATILTAITLFILGSLKTRFTGKNWIYSGLEMLAVGSVAAGAAYLIGYMLQGLA